MMMRYFMVLSVGCLLWPATGFALYKLIRKEQAVTSGGAARPWQQSQLPWAVQQLEREQHPLWRFVLARPSSTWRYQEALDARSAIEVVPPPFQHYRAFVAQTLKVQQHN
jgi:hypothetical protein